MNDRALTTSAVAPSIAESIDTYNRLTAVRNVLAPDLNDQELQLFAMVSQRSGLDPFAKQIYAIKRAGRVTFQTGIDGYRSTAARTGQYEGSSDPEFGNWSDTPFSHPVSATVTVYRWQNGHRVEQTATAWWDEYYPGAKNIVPAGPSAVGFMWLTKPRVMLGKVAEALALRKAFPYVLNDVYVPEEMEQAGPGDSAPLVEAAAQPTARERIAARRQAREDARPGSDPAVPPFSKEEFVQRLVEHHIDGDKAMEISRHMFPDGIKSDADRHALWAAVAFLEPADTTDGEFSEEEQAAIDAALEAVG